MKKIIIIGGVAAGATAKHTVSDLSDIDFAYSPPIGIANDALNMTAFTAENKPANNRSTRIVDV
jgi:hypothetical protein